MATLLPLVMMACICPVESACFEIPLPEVYMVEPYKPRFRVRDFWNQDDIKEWYKQGCKCMEKTKPPNVPEPTTCVLLGCGGVALLRRWKC